MLVGSKQDLEIIFLKMYLLRCFSVGPSIVEEWVMSVALISAPVSNDLGQPVSVAANTNPASRFFCE